MQHRYHALRQAWSHLQALTKDKDSIEARRELLRFQVDEIVRAELHTGEEEVLRQEKRILQNAEKLHQSVSVCEQVLATGDDALTDRLGRIANQVRDCARIDDSLSGVLDLLHSGLAQVEEAALVLRQYGARLTPNPERLDEIENRLALLSRLKRKYGDSVEAVLDQYDSLSQELSRLDDSEESLSALQQDIATAAEAAWTWAQDLSQARRTAAQTLGVRTLFAPKLRSP